MGTGIMAQSRLQGTVSKTYAFRQLIFIKNQGFSTIIYIYFTKDNILLDFKSAGKGDYH